LKNQKTVFEANHIAFQNQISFYKINKLQTKYDSKKENSGDSWRNEIKISDLQRWDYFVTKIEQM